MKSRIKNDICDKARLIYGLTNVLKEDVDELRIVAISSNTVEMRKAIAAINYSIERIIDVTAELEYGLYLQSLEESN